MKTVLFTEASGRFRAVFISIGPLLFGPCLIYIISLFLPENVRTLPLSFQQNWTIFFKALQQLQASDIIFLFIFLYIIMGISLNMELSRQDLHLACKGLLFLEVFFLFYQVFLFYFTGICNMGLIFFFDGTF